MGYGNTDIIQAIDKLRINGFNAGALGLGGGGTGTTTGPTTDGSGTLAGSNVVVFTASLTRNYLRITAPLANAQSIFLQLGSAATTAFPSMEIVPGGSEVWEQGFIPSDSVNVNGTSGDKYIAKRG